MTRTCQYDSINQQKRQAPSLDSSPKVGKRTRTKRHGRLLNGGSSVAPSCDATSLPDNDAILASSSQKGKDGIHALLAAYAEASECITDKEHTVANQDDIQCTLSLASPHCAETYWDSPKARKRSDR
jgi:hypothetical protein